MFTSAEQLIGNRYQLVEQVGQGGMGTVYRAIDRLNRRTVALKRVTAPSSQSGSDSDTNETRLTLANEFQTLASLHHPHIIQVLDYGFDEEKQPYFAMNFVEDPRTITQAGHGQPLTTQIRLLIEMLQALAYLHRHGIIHRDLKPDNALVTPNGDVKVLDFGLAVLREHGNNRESVSGTLAYMAPEVLQEGIVGEPADLYAVGMIACEMIAGRHPFATDNVSQLVQDVLFSQVDTRSISDNPSIVSILTRLLSKSPDGRYQNAHEVIAALSAAGGQPVPPETTAIRESYLQAARFVGRDTQLATLTNALSAALNRKGSTWLVGGESGVGKSRLLDELRTRALVRGALVLHGQAVAEGGLTYQLWRDPLRRLALSTTMSDTNAAVLKQIIPDIEELLGRTVPDVPELTGQAGQQRLINTIISVFRSEDQPMVLLLEDLQWSTESLEVLKALNAVTGELPLLIVGNYRDDETPALPENLPGTQVMKLGRLTDEDIRQLSVSMLGETGRHQEMVDLLKKETEGNAFFVVEVVRALAEEAGQLRDVGLMTLPARVFAGGVQQVVQRRLNRVPEQDRPLLRVAAVAGRQLDPAVLRALSPATDLDEWLAVCSDAAVLDMMEEQWRFAHDKLREGLLGTMNEEERTRLHQQLAATLETVYAGSLEEYAATIADHYEQAGEEAQAAGWYVRAGKHARDNYVPQAVVAYYQKALRFWGTRKPSPAELVKIYEGLGMMLGWQARYAEAIAAYREMQAAAEAAVDPAGQVMARLGAASVQIFQGDIRLALDNITRAEELARAREVRVELARALWLKGWCVFRLGEMDQAQALGEEGMAISTEVRRRDHLAQSLNLLGAVHLTMGRYTQAASHFERALALFEELGDRASVITLGNNLGAIAAARGDFDTAFERYQEALKTARGIGMRDDEMLYLSNLGGARVGLGEYQAAEADLRDAIRLAEAAGFADLSETYRFLAEACLGQGKAAEALAAGQRALALGRDVETPEYIAAAWRVLGQAAARLAVNVEDGDPPRSFDAAACFMESERICDETGMEGEKARTLRAWGKYRLEQGNQAEGIAMLEQARALFAELGADLEVERTIVPPLARSN